MAGKRQRRTRLYDAEGAPAPGFNKLVCDWLRGTAEVCEHSSPAAFALLRKTYDEAFARASGRSGPRWKGHRALFSGLTDMMLSIDISAEISGRLTSRTVNARGFRSALSQGMAKNTGENFINVIVYGLADALSHQDEVLVDKGLPTVLHKALTMRRTFRGRACPAHDLTVPIEGDFCIYSRSDPTNAIVGNAKTRLKEVYHIATMWKLFFDMIEDDHCLKKWGLKTAGIPVGKIQYVFVTADMIPPGGDKTQGPDVEREQPRNLIALDTSFMDYVFVSKKGIAHVADELDLAKGREALFHELGCLFDLIGDKFPGCLQ